MSSTKKRGALLDHLDTIEAKVEKGDITLGEIVFIFGVDGHYVLILFLIIPFLQPVPLLGLSTPFGLVIAFVAILAFLKKAPFVPKRWENKKISAQTVSRIAEGSERILEKIQFLFKPRMKYLFHHPFQIINTSIVIIHAILLSLPLPIPFSNALPAWPIFFMAFAHLEEDGIIVVISYILTLICFAYFILLTQGAIAGINFLK